MKTKTWKQYTVARSRDQVTATSHWETIESARSDFDSGAKCIKDQSSPWTKVELWNAGGPLSSRYRLDVYEEEDE